MRIVKMGLSGAIALTLVTFLPASAQRTNSKPLPKGAFGENVEVIGYTDVNGHIPFKMSIQEVNGRWYLYSASLYDRGWSVLDVTNPSDPTV